MSVALWLARLDQAGKLALLDERLIRLFATCKWLAEAGSDLQVRIWECVGGMVRSLLVNGEDSAHIRSVGPDQTMHHYKGEKGGVQSGCCARFIHRRHCASL